MEPQTTRRWVNGYTYRKNTGSRQGKPVLTPEFSDTAGATALSFLDLTELLFIRHFIERGISIQKIRKAAAVASTLLNSSHPFAIQKMFTDGKSVFARLAQKESDTALLDLVNEQFQLEKIVEPTLLCIDFDAHDRAERWWPLGKNGGVVLDPSRNMGQPILSKYNVRTELIRNLHMAGHGIAEIVDWYELDKAVVEAAIDFENKLAA